MAIVKNNDKSTRKAFALGLAGATAMGAMVTSLNGVDASSTRIANADSVKTTKTQIKKSQIKGLSGKLEQANKNNKTDKQATNDNKQQSTDQQQNDHDLAGQQSYTVVKGDTLNKIASRANIDLPTLLQYNKNLNQQSIIHPGDKINLQEQVDPNETVHTVVKGDTLSKIANDHHVQLNDLYQLNNKSDADTLIHVGDKIKIKADQQNASQADASQQQGPAQQTATTTQNNGGNFTASALSGTTQQKVVQLATQLAHAGIPYVWGGTTTAGFDCSGLTQYVYQQVGINLPRTAGPQSATGTAKPVSAAQPGDILYWGGQGSAYHVGIYIGNNQFVAAPAPGQNVSVFTISPYFMPSGAVTPA